VRDLRPPPFLKSKAANKGWGEHDLLFACPPIDTDQWSDGKRCVCVSLSQIIGGPRLSGPKRSTLFRASALRRKCVKCERLFRPGRCDAEYCSPACQKAASRERARAAQLRADAEAAFKQ
jgi:hypothetical protein